MKQQHDSDCSVHSIPNEPCDCGYQNEKQEELKKITDNNYQDKKQEKLTRIKRTINDWENLSNKEGYTIDDLFWFIKTIADEK